MRPRLRGLSTLRCLHTGLLTSTFDTASTLSLVGCAWAVRGREGALTRAPSLLVHHRNDRLSSFRVAVLAAKR